MNDTEKKLDEAFDKIKAHKYQEGIGILNQMEDRPARWYYVNGYANSCIDNNFTAHEMLVQAVNMEPDNGEYVRLLNHLGGAAQDYQNSEHGSGTGNPDYKASDDCSVKECFKVCCLYTFIEECPFIDI